MINMNRPIRFIHLFGFSNHGVGRRQWLLVYVFFMNFRMQNEYVSQSLDDYRWSILTSWKWRIEFRRSMSSHNIQRTSNDQLEKFIHLYIIFNRLITDAEHFSHRIYIHKLSVKRNSLSEPGQQNHPKSIHTLTEMNNGFFQSFVHNLLSEKHFYK